LRLNLQPREVLLDIIARHQRGGGNPRQLREIRNGRRIRNPHPVRQHDKLLAEEGEIKRLQLENLLKIRNILTAVQLEKLKKLKREKIGVSQEWR
jgi:hypothetical protein